MVAPTGLSSAQPTDHHEVRLRALRAKLGDGFDEREQPLEGHIGARRGHDPTGDTGHFRTRPETPVVDADWDHFQLVWGEPVLLDDVSLGRRRDRENPRDATGDLLLHRHEPVPAAEGQPAPHRRGMAQVECPIDGDRMMAGAEQRPAVRHDPEEAAAEGLVVMDHIELTAAGGQGPTDPPAEGARLGETGRAHDCEFRYVDPGLELPRERNPEGIRLAVEVQARDRHVPHAGIEHRPRLPGEDRHLVAQVHQLTGEVAGVHALTARMRVASVDQEGNPEGVRPGHKEQTVVGARRPVKLTPPDWVRLRQTALDRARPRSTGIDRDRGAIHVVV